MTADAFARWIEPGDTVLDVGANVGFFTVLAAHLTGPTGRVVAVERHQLLGRQEPQPQERGHVRPGGVLGEP